MLNMKKGLAIVLAAATALTFAPLSTLGLTGVVEAQAAITGVNSLTPATQTIASMKVGDSQTDVITMVIAGATAGDQDTLTATSDHPDVVAASVTPATASSATAATATVTLTAKKASAVETTITIKSGVDGTKSTTIKVTKVEHSSFVTSGKITESVYAVSGEKYNLVDTDTSIKYDGVNYTGAELRWLLTPATADLGDNAATLTTDKNIKGATLTENGTLSVSNAADFKGYADSAHANLIGVKMVNGISTVVYKSSAAFAVSGTAEKLTTYAIAASCGKDTANATVISDSAFNGVKLTAANNYYVKGADITAAAGSFSITNNNSLFKLVMKNGSTDWDASTTAAALDSSVNPLKGVQIKLSAAASTVGTYKETATLKYTVSSVNYIAVFNITVTVGQGPKIKIADGANVYGSTYDTTTPSSDYTIYLDLQKNKTFDIAAHTVSDTANTTYSYDSDSANVTVDDKGVITAKSVGTAGITVTPKAAGVEGQQVKLSVRVNANGFDTLTVTGKDKDSAKVLTSKEFANNTVNTEKALALRQINYVQIEVTGNESTNITEKPDVVSANKATLTYSFAKQQSPNVKINPTTGEITIPYGEVRSENSAALGVYAVKVVSADTATSVQTVSYYYVVVDYPDLSLEGVADQYTVGVCTSHETEDDPAVKFSDESKNAETVEPVNKNTDKFVGSDAYDKDDTSKFNTRLGSGIVYSAKADGQIMHVLVSNSQTATHGNTYKLVTLKSAPANDNYVAKIVNKDTGDVIYDATKDAAETAKKLIIEDTTNLQVTLHTPVAVSGSAVSLNIHKASNNNGSVIDQDRYVTAVKNSNNIDVVLYPNQVGTQVISIAPGGHNTKTDRTDIHHKATLLAVVYNGVVAPTKVTGVKVANKKGAAVSVSWKSQGEKVLYRVYKKVGSGKWVAKNVKGTKTTLKVKKGAKVTVKVKAYKKTDAGKTVWGPKATKVTKKTDKK